MTSRSWITRVPPCRRHCPCRAAHRSPPVTPFCLPALFSKLRLLPPSHRRSTSSSEWGWCTTGVILQAAVLPPSFLLIRSLPDASAARTTVPRRFFAPCELAAGFRGPGQTMHYWWLCALLGCPACLPAAAGNGAICA